ncbi:MAG TPA: VOC family protein [Anaerolineales bacterium]|nr:VOC family protein [Anaerolineales bacterium]
MRFNGICLITRDVPRLRGFYTTILQVEAEGDDTFTMLSTQGAVLSIFTEEGMEHMAPGSMQDSGCGRYTLEFEVEDVDREYERLKTINVIFVKPPTTQTWGRRSIWFRDPDGNIINFFAKVDS